MGSAQNLGRGTGSENPRQYTQGLLDRQGALVYATSYPQVETTRCALFAPGKANGNSAESIKCKSGPLPVSQAHVYQM